MKSNLQTIIHSITYQIYDPIDIAYGIELKQTIEKFEEAKTYFKDYNFYKEYDIDNIADYFIVRKICAYKKEYLKPEFFDQFNEIKEFYYYVFEKFNKEKMNIFFENFNFEIENGYYDLIFEIYKLLPHAFGKLSKKVYAKAIEKHSYLILDYYKSYKNIFTQYKDLYNLLFSKENVKNYCISLDSRFVKVSKDIYKDKNIKEVVLKNSILKAFIDKADLIVKSKDLKNALHNKIMYKTILDFMQDIKFGEYAEYKDYQKQVDDLCEEWLKKNGQTFSYELPTKQIREFFNKKDVNPVTKQISLTHSKKGKSLKHYSYDIIHAKKGLTDLCCYVNEHNDNFTMSVLSSLSISNQLYCHSLNMYLVNKEHFEDYIDCIISMIEYAILSIAFQDVNGNYWEQPLFIPFNKIYDSYQISHKDYHSDITIDDAEDCFMHPWMW